MNLSRELHRLPDLKLCLDARNEVVIDLNGRKHVCGPHAFRLLEIFSHSVAVAEALETLKPSFAGTQDWLQALRTIQQMESAGILVDKEGHASAAPFDQASIHIAMLNDRPRTQSFIEAIRQLVKPGDVVADLGTGTGVLAAAAVQAGARKAYAIEAGAVREQAAALFRDNDLEQQVEIIPGWSTQVTLPEPVDVLLGELLGNDPFGEDIVDVFRDGVRRFLKPGGKVLPARVELWAVLVSVPNEITAVHRFEDDVLQAWEQDYGIKFGTLKPQDEAAVFTVSTQVASQWAFLSKPVRLMQSNLMTGEQMPCPPAIDIPCASAGQVNGVLFYFKAALTEDIEISTNPETADADCHWRNVVRLFPVPQQGEIGKVIKLNCATGYLAAKLMENTSA